MLKKVGEKNNAKEKEKKVYMLTSTLRKKRIKAGSGEKMRKKGAKGAPTAKNFKQAAKTAKKERRKDK